MKLVLPTTLIFVRHAIAVPAEEFAGDDADRPLTTKGMKKARAVFKTLAAHFPPTRIISSPFVRAKDTAHLYLEVAEAPHLTIECAAALQPEATWEEWAEYLRSEAKTFKRDDVAVVFGHEPSIGKLFSRHLGLKGTTPFKKAGVGILAPESMNAATLVGFFSPKFVR